MTISKRKAIQDIMLKELRKPKDALFDYGKNYQKDMVAKYRNRNNNHWKFRIELAFNLVDEYILPMYQRKPKKEIVVVDVGCSIGTFAIEFAKLGYNNYGIDFDSSAIDIAKQLANEEKVKPEFICGDIANWSKYFPPIDVAICFDIFEHLHDDELGSFLSSIRKNLSDKGALIFHTFPTQYDHIFFGRYGINYSLFPFRNISQSRFNKIVKAYSCLYDALLLLITGKTYKERIEYSGHCNPTTGERLKKILNRSGYKIVVMKPTNLYNFKSAVQKHFCKQPITFRNLYGAAITKPTLLGKGSL